MGRQGVSELGKETVRQGKLDARHGMTGAKIRTLEARQQQKSSFARLHSTVASRRD